MAEDSILFQVIVVGVQAMIALAGFIGALMIGRLIKSIDRLAAEDAVLHERITRHREDMLANYVRHENLDVLKKDLIGRVDRFELSVTKLFTDHERHEQQVLEGIKDLIIAKTNKEA